MTRLVLARDAITGSARTRLAHRAQSGDLVRVMRGAFVDPTVWAALTARGRFRLRVEAAAATAREPLVLCRAAAAVVHGLPWLGRWPERVDVLVPPDSPSRSSTVLRRHREPLHGFEIVDGLSVTTIEHTVIGIAREADFARAIVVADAALARGVSVTEAADTVPLRHGSARARAVAAFADGRAASVGESVSRVTMRAIGIDPPVLQQEFARPDGGVWNVDFWWPDLRVIGEFDGDSKYLDPEQRGGRTPAEVMLDEKRREDGLRRLSAGFARWDWAVARSPRLLAERLASAGVTPRRPRTFV